MLAESILHCKVLAQKGIKGNKTTDKAVKKALDMPDVTTLRLPSKYYLLSKHN